VVLTEESLEAPAWKTKAEDANELFFEYLGELDNMKPTAREVIKNFPVYVGYVSLARFLFLYDLYKRVFELSGHIGEVGTYRGSTLMFFGKLIRLFEPHSYTQAHGFDWFRGMKPGAEDDLGESGKWMGDYETLVKLVALQGLDDCVVVHRMDVKTELPKFFSEHDYMRFKLVFLDCGIRDVLVKSLECFWPRLVPGGILVVDHYNNAVSPSESNVIEETIGSHRIHQMPFTRQPTGYIVKDAPDRE
jgi:hypothetical protein